MSSNPRSTCRIRVEFAPPNGLMASAPRAHSAPRRTLSSHLETPDQHASPRSYGPYGRRPPDGPRVPERPLRLLRILLRGVFLRVLRRRCHRGDGRDRRRQATLRRYRPWVLSLHHFCLIRIKLLLQLDGHSHEAQAEVWDDPELRHGLLYALLLRSLRHLPGLQRGQAACPGHGAAGCHDAGPRRADDVGGRPCLSGMPAAEPNEEEPFRSIERNRAKPSDKPSVTRTAHQNSLL